MILRSYSLIGALALATASCSLDMSRQPISSTKPAPSVDADIITPSDGIAHLTVNAGKSHQTLIGFGAAVAWYTNYLTGFGADSPINDAAFRDLGLDIIRLRDHYGRQEANNPSSINDEVTVLARATKSLGHSPKILLSSWSPPASLKLSGKELCRDTDAEESCTLVKDANGFVYDQFANYFVESLDYYAASGIVPDYLSIQNEPNYTPNGWEGCRLEATESRVYPAYDKALSAVHTALSSVSDAPILIGPEPISLDNNVLDTYMSDVTRPLLGGIAHHMYSRNSWTAPDSYQPEMKDALATANGVPLWQTEFDTQNGAGDTGGFETAWVIHNSLAVENISAFLYWGLIWPSNSAGLIWVTRDANTKTMQFTLRDQYYAVRHFARYTDPGYVRVDATSSLSDVRVSAYVSPDSSQLTMVLLNVGSSDVNVQLDSMAGFSAPHTEAYRTLFRTGDAGVSERWQQLDGFDVNQLFTLPSRSVVTVVMNSSIAADAAVTDDAGS